MKNRKKTNKKQRRAASRNMESGYNFGGLKKVSLVAAGLTGASQTGQASSLDVFFFRPNASFS